MIIKIHFVFAQIRNVDTVDPVHNSDHDHLILIIRIIISGRIRYPDARVCYCCFAAHWSMKYEQRSLHFTHFLLLERENSVRNDETVDHEQGCQSEESVSSFDTHSRLSDRWERSGNEESLSCQAIPTQYKRQTRSSFPFPVLRAMTVTAYRSAEHVCFGNYYFLNLYVW